jgi:hypothetical protein
MCSMSEKDVKLAFNYLMNEKGSLISFIRNSEVALTGKELRAIKKVQNSKLWFNIATSHSHEITNYDVSNHIKSA